MADGRAVMRSSVREFIASEAMHHLGVPTTRALSLVGTGDAVVRDMFYKYASLCADILPCASQHGRLNTVESFRPVIPVTDYDQYVHTLALHHVEVKSRH